MRGRRGSWNADGGGLKSAEGEAQREPEPEPGSLGPLKDGMDCQDGSCDSVPKEDECDVCGSCWHCCVKADEVGEDMSGNTVS
jgi:hypothetical protein